MRHFHAIGAVVMWGALAFPASAQYSDVGSYFVNATGHCAGALPAHEGRLRKRPTGIRNDGDADAFVSCSLPSDIVFDKYAVMIAYLSAPGTGAGFATCTLVNGAMITSAMYYLTKDSEPDARGKPMIVWFPHEISPGYETFPFPWINLSCRLSPQTELAMIAAMPLSK